MKHPLGEGEEGAMNDQLHKAFQTSRYRGMESEWRAAKHLQDYGWRLFISPGSRGPADFIAIGPRGTAVAVQSKSGQSGLNAIDTDALLSIANPIGATAILTHRGPGGRIVWKAFLNGGWKLARVRWTVEETSGAPPPGVVGGAE